MSKRIRPAIKEASALARKGQHTHVQTRPDQVLSIRAYKRSLDVQIALLEMGIHSMVRYISAERALETACSLLNVIDNAASEDVVGHRTISERFRDRDIARSEPFVGTPPGFISLHLVCIALSSREEERFDMHSLLLKPPVAQLVADALLGHARIADANSVPRNLIVEG